MRYALIDNVRFEAMPGLKGLCPVCLQPVIAKCGQQKINHWAHKGKRDCDPWWENETEWHRSWKGKFPDNWQEVPFIDPSSEERHRADIKTDEGWILEFQHSYLKPEERRARNDFYKRIIWVVDGLRRKNDKKQFDDIVKNSTAANKDGLIKQVRCHDECRLLNEWKDNNALVFFDFQQPVIWFLFPGTLSSKAYLSHLQRDKFIEMHNNNQFNNLVERIIDPIRTIIVQNEQRIKQNQKTEDNSVANRYLNGRFDRRRKWRGL
jgi:hypothetical protein